MKKRKIYLAGKMRGLNDLGYESFTEGAVLLREHFKGSTVFNPAEAFGGDKTRDLRDYFAADFTFIIGEADTIAFLPGWQGSEGSLCEFTMARALGLDFILLPDPKVREASEWPEHAPVAYEAHRLVFGDRGNQYGHPAQNFEDIAAAWNAHLDTSRIDPLDVAFMMTQFKIARGKHGYKRDNMIDAIGYIIAGQRVVDGK